MQNIIPDKPLSLVATDLYGPLPTSKGGDNYIMVLVDVSSKYISMYPIRKATGEAVAAIVGDKYISQVGKPLISAYNSSSNPAERYMREIGRLCKTYCSHKHPTWIEHISSFEKIMNSLQHSSAVFTPFEIHNNKKVDNFLSENIDYPVCTPISAQDREEIVRATMKKQGEARKKT